MVLLFGTFFLSLASLLPRRSTFYLSPSGSSWKDILFVWVLSVTIGCVVLLFQKNQERRDVYRGGVLASYLVFLVLVVGILMIGR